MESLLASESGNGISSNNAVSELPEGTIDPTVGGVSDGTTHQVGAKAFNPWGVDAEE